MNYTKFLIAILVLCISFICTSLFAQDEKAGSIFREVDKSLKKINNFSYTLNHYYKHYTKSDTSISIVKVLQKRMEADAMGAYHVMAVNSISSSDPANYLKRYDGRHIFISDYDQDEIKVVDVKQEGYGCIRGNSSYQFLLPHFFERGYFRKYNSIFANLLIKKMTVKDTVINNTLCFGIDIAVKDTRDIKQNFITHYISKNDYLPIAYRSTSVFDGMNDYVYYEINYDAINAVLPTDTFAIEVNNSFKQAYKETKDSSKSLIEKGSLAPDFIATDVIGNQIQLSELKGSVVVLDFWYISCYPCLKAIPELNRLYAKFKERDVTMIGVNTMDSKDKVFAFSKERNINYSSTYKSAEIASLFGIKAFPTTIVINKEGIVEWVEEGWDKGYEKKLEQLLNKLSQ